MSFGGTTSDNLDAVMQVNFLGHFLLTRLLMPALLNAEDPRVINVTSSLNKLADASIAVKKSGIAQGNTRHALAELKVR